MTLQDQAKAHTTDQTKVDEFPDFIAPAGLSMARFMGYVEVGVRKQKPWKGQAKADAAEARFTFELLSPKNIREIEVDGVKTQVTDVIGCKVAMKMSDKSAFTKLLKKMAAGREGILNFAQMLGEPFLINVIHAEGKDREGNKKTYANMKDADFNWTISAPVQADALTGTVVQLPVPEGTIDMRLLLWDNPTVEQWASVFIDGEREVKAEDGTTKMESKNWLQRDIVTEALNFAGSALEAMLNGLSDADLAIPGDVAEGPTPLATDAIAAVAAEMEADEARVAALKAASLAEMEVKQAAFNAAAAAAALAITESNKALEEAGQPVGKSVPEQMAQSDAEALAQAQALIAKLTGG